jgi:hypothetical protein
MNGTAATLAAVALLAATAAAAPAGGYAVAVDGATTEIPTQSVTIGGETYTVDRVALRERNGTVSVEATGPPGDGYDVNLYDSAGDVRRSSRKSGGNTTTTFDLDVGPGTYAVVVYDGDIEALAAVVVAGYEVDLQTPDAAETGDAIGATVELNRTAGGTVERVEVVLAGEQTVRVPAEPTGETTYEATLPLDGLPAGSYDARGVVFGADTFGNGENEILGLGPGRTLTVEGHDAAHYAESDGTVGSSGLRASVDDWRTGETTTAVLRDVVDYWRTGDPVG